MLEFEIKPVSLDSKRSVVIKKQTARQYLNRVSFLALKKVTKEYRKRHYQIFTQKGTTWHQRAASTQSNTKAALEAIEKRNLV